MTGCGSAGSIGSMTTTNQWLAQVRALEAIRLLATGRAGPEWDEVREQLKSAGVLPGVDEEARDAALAELHAQLRDPRFSGLQSRAQRVASAPAENNQRTIPEDVAAFINSNAGVASVSELAALIDETEGRVRAWARENTESVRRLGSTFCFTLSAARLLLDDFAEQDGDDPEETDKPDEPAGSRAT